MKLGEVVDGRYQLVRQIGVGGMGSVWEAQDLATGGRVAVKALHEHLVDQRELVSRFLREGQAAMESRYSSHVIEVLAVVSPSDGPPHLVMEFLEGEELRDLIEREGRLEPQRAVELIIQTCDAVAEVHRQGLIHRDIKPENLFVTHLANGTDWIKLLDFGVVKLSSAADSEHLTGFGRTLGTPHYMAPEQGTAPDTIDHRVDIYAAGVVLYELLAGEVPFDDADERKLVAKRALEAPPPLHVHCPEIDRGLEQVVLRAMAPNRRKRFQTMFDFAQALEPFRATGRAQGPAGPAVRGLRTVQEETPEAVAGIVAELRRGPRRGWPARRLVWVAVAAAVASALVCALLIVLAWRSCGEQPAEPAREDLSATPILATGPDGGEKAADAGRPDEDAPARADAAAAATRDASAGPTWKERYGERLDRATLNLGLRALSPVVGRCLGESRPAGTRVLVHFWVFTDGRVSYRTARPELAPASERCLRRALRSKRVAATGVPPFVATRTYVASE